MLRVSARQAMMVMVMAPSTMSMCNVAVRGALRVPQKQLRMRQGGAAWVVARWQQRRYTSSGVTAPRSSAFTLTRDVVTADDALGVFMANRQTATRSTKPQLLLAVLAKVRMRVWFDNHNNGLRQLDRMSRLEGSLFTKPESALHRSAVDELGKKVPKNRDVFATEATLHRDERFAELMDEAEACMTAFDVASLLALADHLGHLHVQSMSVWKGIVDGLCLAMSDSAETPVVLSTSELTGIVHHCAGAALFPKRLVDRLVARIKKDGLGGLDGAEVGRLLKALRTVHFYDAALFRVIRGAVERDFDRYDTDDVFEIMASFKELGFPIRMLDDLVAQRGVFDKTPTKAQRLK